MLVGRSSGYRPGTRRWRRGDNVWYCYPPEQQRLILLHNWAATFDIVTQLSSDVWYCYSTEQRRLILLLNRAATFDIVTHLSSNVWYCYSTEQRRLILLLVRATTFDIVTHGTVRKLTIIVYVCPIPSGHHQVTVRETIIVYVYTVLTGSWQLTSHMTMKSFRESLQVVFLGKILRHLGHLLLFYHNHHLLIL